VAEGLEEAHAKGIVHRDVKPANIMITSNGLVKLMDFGLAEIFEPAALADETTSGTVSYMSPEQLRSEGADRRSDIWALGVVLYEMLAGRRPFEGEYEQAVVYSVLNLEPEPPAAFRGGVSAELERVVAKCLEKDAADRYQTVQDLLSDLRILVRDSEDVGEERRTVAVISFENLTGDGAHDYLSRAIPNLLITSLEQASHVRVTTWERMRDLLKQLGRGDEETIDRDLGFELCRMDGVEAIVLGSFVKAGEMFATDVKVLDVSTKGLIKSFSAKGQGLDSILATQIDELAGGIVRGLGVPDRTRGGTSRQPIAEVTTSSLDAYDSFLKGRDSFERIYNTDARDHLERAVSLDPTFAAAYLYLAWTYTRLRETGARDDAFEKAKSFSERASLRERLYIEAAYARTVELDSDKEVRALKQIAREYPDEKLVHHRLAGYYRARNLLYQAVEEYNRVLDLDPNFGWAMNELAYMYTDVEDFQRAREYFERYAAASPGDANPVDSLGELSFRMGRLDDAIAMYERALELKPDFYYAYWEIAYVSALKEDYAEAMRWIDSFIERAPSFGTMIEGHRWRALYLCWTGRARQALEEAEMIAGLALAEGSELWQVEAGRMRAWIHAARDELEAARRHFQTCLAAVTKNPRVFVPVATSYSAGSLEQIPLLAAGYGFALALIELRSGRVGEAEARLAEVDAHLPEYAGLLRAELLLARGDADGAISVAEREPPWRTPYMSDTEGFYAHNLPPIKDALARAYREKGDAGGAIAEYERLLTVDERTRDRRLIHPKYHLRLAELYREAGRGEEARRQYERFLELWRDADGDLPEVSAARAGLEAS